MYTGTGGTASLETNYEITYPTLYQWELGPVQVKGRSMKIQLYSEIVEENGRTIRENNMNRCHKIPIGTLVEIEFDNSLDRDCWERGRARLYVVDHIRDCDGTPLYSLGSSLTYYNMPWINQMVRNAMANVRVGYPEDKLKIISQD